MSKLPNVGKGDWNPGSFEFRVRYSTAELPHSIVLMISMLDYANDDVIGSQTTDTVCASRLIDIKRGCSVGTETD